jgi:predicted acylesterase/phospholipase RssA
MKAANLLLLSSLASTSAKECKALSMSGGGSEGAYEAGGLWGLYYNTPEDQRDKFAYDVVTGVSAGSINTACVSLFAPGDEANMLTYMTETW